VPHIARPRSGSPARLGQAQRRGARVTSVWESVSHDEIAVCFGNDGGVDQSRRVQHCNLFGAQWITGLFQLFIF
jgi:hypothetical protein